jgi:hypothetical protein
MKHLHIVTTIYPYPPRFGTAAEIYHTIKSLSELGIKIFLHCVESKNHEPVTELEQYCEKVFMYRPKRIWTSVNAIPDIVYSAGVPLLLKNLISIEAPILFEGLESCFFLGEPTLKSRYKLVRVDKISSKYYLEKSIGKSKLSKWYYEKEAMKFREFESVLNHANMILSISPRDYNNFCKKYNTKSYYLPAFHSEKKYRVPEGTGKFCLFHARLDRQLNHDSAMFLIKHVFSELPFKLLIAGEGAKPELRKTISEHANIKLKEHLNDEEIMDLVKKSQINLMPAIGTTGIKQFLLHLLFNGRHLIASEKELEGLGFDDLYISAKSPIDWKAKISELMSLPIEEPEFLSRYEKLNLNYNNRFNGNILSGLILDKVPEQEE